MHDAFDHEFDALPKGGRGGGSVGNPWANAGATLCRHAQGLEAGEHEELRFDTAGGVWRAAFAFDPERRAVALVAADKRGVTQTRFYEALIARATAVFETI